MSDELPFDTTSVLDQGESVKKSYRSSQNALRKTGLIIIAIFLLVVVALRSVVYGAIYIGIYPEGIVKPFNSWVVLSLIAGLLFIIIFLAVLSMKVDVFITDNRIIAVSKYFFVKQVVTDIKHEDIAKIEKSQDFIDRMSNTWSVSVYTEEGTDEQLNEELKKSDLDLGRVSKIKNGLYMTIPHINKPDEIINSHNQLSEDN